MAQNPNYDANVVKQILAVTNNGNKQMLTQMFNDPAKRYLQPAIILAGMQSDADQRQIALQQGAQPTVAAKTLGVAPPPPAPPAGLGATPQGMQMAGGPAPQGAPAPQGMPKMAGGGLTTLPIPDSMLDERTFADGGIVAFAPGGSVEAKRRQALRTIAQDPKRSAAERGAAMQELTAFATVSNAPIISGGIASLSSGDFEPDEPVHPLAGFDAAGALAGYFNGTPQTPPPATSTPTPRAPAPITPTAAAPAAVVPPPAALRPHAPAGPAKATTPEDDYGIPKAPGEFDQTKNFDEILKMMGPAPKFAGMSAEEKAAKKNDDLYSTLAQIGFGMAAGKSQNALSNIGEGAAAAMPGMQAALKERRADEKEERQAQFEQDKTEYGARGTAAAATRAEKSEAQKYGLSLAEARAKIANEKAKLDIERQQLANTAGYYNFLKTKDSDSITRDAKIILDAGKANNMEDARYLAWKATQVRSNALGKPKDPLVVRKIAETAYDKQFTAGMKPEPKEGRAAWIANYASNIMAKDSDESDPTANPHMSDADKILGL